MDTVVGGTEINMPLIKRGETVMQVNVRRNTGGLFIGVKVHPSVEDFMRSLGTGETQDIRALGRHWTSFPKGTEEFQVYNMGTGTGVLTGPKGTSFRFDRPGHPLVESTGTVAPNGRDYIQAVNLGFLRIRGVSEGEGVRFHVRGVYTDEAVTTVAQQIKEACRDFYNMYLKPIDLAVMVSTQEIPA